MMKVARMRWFGRKLLKEPWPTRVPCAAAAAAADDDELMRV
jgi:hypothetical protein